MVADFKQKPEKFVTDGLNCFTTWTTKRSSQTRTRVQARGILKVLLPEPRGVAFNQKAYCFMLVPRKQQLAPGQRKSVLNRIKIESLTDRKFLQKLIRDRFRFPILWMDRERLPTTAAYLKAIREHRKNNRMQTSTGLFRNAGMRQIILRGAKHGKSGSKPDASGSGN